MAEETQATPSTRSTYPALGIAGVLLGVIIATFLGRLISVGNGDLRGALHLDYDAASWISTSYNMGLMFIGPFSVYLGALLGPRRVLLACAGIFTILCIFMPLAGYLSLLLILLALGGLTSGTFFPLTLSFILRNLPQRYLLYGVAGYVGDVLFTTYVAHSYEAWILRVLSWRWIFWTDVVLTPLMMILIYFGIEPQPLPQLKPGQHKPDWRGFVGASTGAALLYGALDQGERLDWWRSGTFVALVTVGTLLIAVAAIHYFLRRKPLITFSFLRRPNTILLAGVLFLFRFLLLGTIVILPGYLTSVRGYSAEQIGPALLWLALPVLLAGVFAVYLLERIDARLVLATGVALIGLGSLMNSHLSSDWSGSSFRLTQLILAVGEGFTCNGLVGTILLDLLNSAPKDKPIELLTFAGFFQSIRLLGGECGVAFMSFFLQRREQFHSNILGLHVQSGSSATNERLYGLAAGMQANSSSSGIAAARASTLLGQSVHQQAFTLAVADCFLVTAYAAVVCLVVVACIGSLQIQYKQELATLKSKGHHAHEKAI